jgi:threonine/homoserine/homoserine lactone efflux protein
MHDYIFLLPIVLLLLLGVISPGPSFILVAQTAMAKTRAEAIATAVGMGVGATIFTIVASIGLFILLASVPIVYSGLKILGGSYLCLLALTMWRSANSPIEQNIDNNRNNNGLLKMFFAGLLTQLSNPKTAIVIGGVIAAFLPKEVPAYSYYIICLLAFIIDCGWYTLVATLLSTSKAQKTYTKFQKTIGRVASGFMGAIGIKLIFSQQ